MLEDIRAISRDYLFRLILRDTQNNPEQQRERAAYDHNPEEWYREKAANHRAQITPYLSEDISSLPHVYIIEEDEDGLLRVQVQDITTTKEGGGCPASSLLFIRPTGPNAAQIGPVLKRTKNGASPKPSVISLTISNFNTLAHKNSAWQTYFAEVLEVLDHESLTLSDGSVVTCSDLKSASATPLHLQRAEWVFNTVIKNIPDTNTVIVTVRTKNGLLPGEDVRYQEYFSANPLSPNVRYVVKDTHSVDDQICPLCTTPHVTIYPQALAAVGINFLNADRHGSFPGLDKHDAWKRYAICGPCADLLFIFKNAIVGSKGNRQLVTSVGGDLALIIPALSVRISPPVRQELWDGIYEWIGEDAKRDTQYQEESLLDILKDSPGIVGFSMLWADFGDSIDDVTGTLYDVLPTRLRTLSQVNRRVQNDDHPLFPTSEPNHRLSFDLSYRTLKQLLWYPKASSSALKNLRHHVVGAIYQRERWPDALWNDWFLHGAQSFLIDVANPQRHSSLISHYLTTNEDVDQQRPSAALWMRRIAQFLWFLQQPTVEVLAMPTVSSYEPTWDRLKLYMGPESGINTPAKAYAFFIGIFYGKLIAHMTARKVDVNANGISLLKRLTIKSQDLPALYTRIYNKLSVYGATRNPELRKLNGEFAKLAISLGDDVVLTDIQTIYYLFLGMAVCQEIVTSVESQKKSHSLSDDDLLELEMP